VKLPRAPKDYDPADQDRLRAQLEDVLTRLDQTPDQRSAAGWVQWTGTAARGTQNADGPPTLTQVAQAVKALIDDLVLKVKS
jgi:hypothetical protein